MPLSQIFIRDSLIIISQISEFVNSFSKIFSAIFLEIIFQCIYCFIQSIPIGFLYSFRRLFYYTTDFLFCQVLFSTFSKFLLSLSWSDLIIISQSFAFVKPFSEDFLNSFQKVWFYSENNNIIHKILKNVNENYLQKFSIISIKYTQKKLFRGQCPLNFKT